MIVVAGTFGWAVNLTPVAVTAVIVFTPSRFPSSPPMPATKIWFPASNECPEVMVSSAVFEVIE